MDDGAFWQVMIVGLVVAGLVALVVCGMQGTAEFEKECQRRGGHRHAIYKSSDLCISADGRILEIRR